MHDSRSKQELSSIHVDKERERRKGSFKARPINKKKLIERPASQIRKSGWIQGVASTDCRLILMNLMARAGGRLSGTFSGLVFPASNICFGRNNMKQRIEGVFSTPKFQGN